MDTVNWGIIGCGDVTEVKSGPAFGKAKNSALIAVMRRNAEKCRDYARRHQVPKWYTDADKLIQDPDVNAIYIATPPSSHEEYTMAALKAGKPVYVEKPMTTSVESAARMKRAVEQYRVKLVVAHYRRAQPRFVKIRELIDSRIIGEIKFVECHYYRKNLTPEKLEMERYAWRIDETIAGVGLFYDMAPHQLDMMYHLFGEVESADGFAVSRNKLYSAPDLVTGHILFKNKVMFTGTWCFDVGENEQEDSCVIIGENGNIRFSFFDRQEVQVTVNGKPETLIFDELLHAQQPMIEQVVGCFRGENPNPDSVEEGVAVMKLLERLSKKTSEF